MRRKRISIVTGAHLCRNPRVVKEASALQSAGYLVTVFGPALEESLVSEDTVLAAEGGFKHVYAVDIRHTAGVQRHIDRVQRRLALEMSVHAGWETESSLGYGVHRLRRAVGESGADLVIGHQEIGLLIVRALMKRGQTVAFDMEDWHSEDQLDDRGRPIELLKRAEQEVLQRAKYVVTTSDAMADALAERYQAPRPTTIYNVFPWSDRKRIDGLNKDRVDRTRLSVHWVSQTIGPGRGLEQFVSALRLIEQPIDIHLRGRSSVATEEWLRSLIPSSSSHRLFLHDLVSSQELLSRVVEHDVGLALEMSQPASRNLTVTNKVFHYLLGGVPLLMSDTGGQMEIARRVAPAAALCDLEDPVSVARALTTFAADPSALSEAKAAAIRAAELSYCWEREQNKLLDCVESVFRTV